MDPPVFNMCLSPFPFIVIFSSFLIQDQLELFLSFVRWKNLVETGIDVTASPEELEGEHEYMKSVAKVYF